jgi:uncharacterized protein
MDKPLVIDTLEERSLADRLKLRIEREKQFAATGRKLRNKSWLFKQEKVWIRPLLKLALQATGLYSRGVQNALTPVVRNLRLSFPNLPPDFEGYTLLHLSDLHIDGVDGLAETLGETIRELHPDLCVITGDYRFEDEGPCEDVYPRMRTLLSNICAPDGIYAILGNHDISEIAFRLQEMGIRMLVNEAVEISRGEQSIWVAGIDDPFDYKCDDLPATLQPVPNGAFTVLLAHTPEVYRSAAELGVNLYLCGHTHAGQIQLPVLGCIRHNADCPKEFAHGYWRFGPMQGYTSAGAGCSALPVRFNCPPELIMIELHSKVTS